MVYVTFVINEELMSLYQDLINLESENKPIKVGVIGAGQMGIGLIAQIATLKGMIVSGICNRTLSKAESAKAIYNKHTNRYHNCFITSDYKELIHSKEVDIVVDATGNPESGANICLETLKAHKHIVLLNVEMDITVGPILYNKFKEANLIYTGSDGDEPAAIFELYEFARSLGLEVLVAGKGKNNKIRLEANPDTVAEEAQRRHMTPHMLASFADGTKTMAEMTLLSNSIGFKPDIIGMHGIKGDLKQTVEQLSTKQEGGVLNNYQVVEYVDGIAPGVFVIVKGQNSYVTEELNYMMQVFTDHQILYRPFHLGSLETPLTIAKAYLKNEASIYPLYGQVSDTVAVAKKDLEIGESLDYIGGYTFRGVITTHEEAIKNYYVPIGLCSERVTVKNPIKKGEFIKYSDLNLDTESTIYKLRLAQDKL